MVGVVGSSPIAPTKKSKGLAGTIPLTLFRFFHLRTTLGTKTDGFRPCSGLHHSLPRLSSLGFQPGSRRSEPYFTSRNEDRISGSEVPLLTPADLVTLPKGQAFALIEGGQLYKVRMPPTVPPRSSWRRHGAASRRFNEEHALWEKA
jgi:hypothetical protein